MGQAAFILGILTLIGFLWWDQVTRRGTSAAGFLWWATALTVTGVGSMMVEAPRAPWFVTIGLPAFTATVFYGFYYVFVRAVRRQ